MMRRPVLFLALLGFACGKRAAPPGAAMELGGSATGVSEVGTPTPAPAAAVSGKAARRKGAATAVDSAPAQAPNGGPAPGSVDDNLPFTPDGTRIASVAWRTWVYTDTGKQRSRYGYLRAGAVVDARGPAIVNDGCQGGWYRVNPRGFVCVGLGASLKLDDPVAVASVNRPVRGQGAPYLYALSNETPPLLYFKLPSKAQMKDGEGYDVSVRAANFRERMRTTGKQSLLGELGPPPDFLSQGQTLNKPYGVKSPLRYLAHAGPASADSGFAISKTFLWQERAFGLTTELDIIALDRVKLVEPSEFRGVELLEGEALPVAFVKDRSVPKYAPDANGNPVSRGSFGYREGLKLATGKRMLGGLMQMRDGSFAAEVSLRILPARDSFPSFATGDRKWVDISILHQTLVAYVGKRPVYATLVSTGRGGMGDPETQNATVRGTFMIYQKEVSSTMDGDEDRSDSFNLRDVPFVQYFHKGFALHGTYWHDDFGKVRSHGCVNLAPIDAAWLFEWTDPSVPADWHGAVNKERGTVVYIHG
ncbi:MAG: L,D-transpeptidase family protein [Pseudomonadota bacterium]